jgi:hypothetical protein
MGEYKTATAWNDLFKSETHCENFLSTLTLKKSATHFKATKIPLRKWFAALYELGTNDGKLTAVMVARDYEIEIKASQRLVQMLKHTIYKGQIPLERVKTSNKGKHSQGFSFEIAPDCTCEWYYFRRTDNLQFTSVEERDFLRAARDWESRASDREKHDDRVRTILTSIRTQNETALARLGKERHNMMQSDLSDSEKRDAYHRNWLLGKQLYDERQKAENEASKQFSYWTDPRPYRHYGFEKLPLPKQ